ncbi:MAG TPA: hypothetical protein VGC59_04055 [Solirubrobacteraceae bacterium]
MIVAAASRCGPVLAELGDVLGDQAARTPTFLIADRVLVRGDLR